MCPLLGWLWCKDYDVDDDDVKDDVEDCDIDDDDDSIDIDDDIDDAYIDDEDKISNHLISAQLSAWHSSSASRPSGSLDQNWLKIYQPTKFQFLK